jgi:hypothetical protein
MADDLLAQYRRTPPAPKGGVLPPKEIDEYAAFGSRDKVHRLRICNASPLINSPGYNLLVNVTSDGRLGTHFILAYTVMLVEVKGRNLQKLIFAIENHMADFIQEFDPERWQKPAAADTPFIESIQVVMKDNATFGENRH